MVLVEDREYMTERETPHIARDAHLLDSDVLFPSGLIGYPQLKHFHLEPLSDLMPVGRLVCTDVPGLSLIVADPRIWDPSYDVAAATTADSNSVDADRVDLALVILTIHAIPLESSVNLLGPLLINLETGEGQQAIQSGSGYRADHPLGDGLQAIRFEEGMIGCPDWREFLLLDVEKNGALGMLVSLDEPFVAFPVMEPERVHPEYAPTLFEADLEALGAEGNNDLRILVIVNIPQDVEEATVNLLGPLVVHGHSGNARQIVLVDSGYPADYPITGGEKR